jgi:hypothetical protein
MLKITVDVGNLSDSLNELPEVVKAALLGEANSIAEFLLEDVVAKAGGDVLQVRSGSYVGSFQTKVKVNPKSVVGQVFTKDPRAGWFEWGGHTDPREIRPKNGTALHFQTSSGGGFFHSAGRALGMLPSSDEVFAMVVHHPGAFLPRGKYSVLHSTYIETRDDVANRLIQAGSSAATGKLSQSGGGD